MDVVKKYIDGSHDDLRTAEALFAMDMPFYVPFLCHQALLKLLRGFFLERQNRYPIYETHLPTLAEAAGAMEFLDGDSRSFLHELSFYPEVIAHSVYREKILKYSKSAREMVSHAGRISGRISQALEE
jgi:hypothetical protein